MQILFYSTLLIVTTLVWGYIFYKKDYHPQPLKVILQSFFIGLFAMIPVFGYKYVYQHFLPAISEFQIFRPLLDSALFSGLSVFLLNLVTLSLLLFALSGIVSVILNFTNHNIVINLKNALKQEPFGFAMVSLLLGLLIYGQALAEKFFDIPVIGTIVGTILFLAIIEEYIKHLMVRIVDDKKLRDIDDAITLSIIMGLAFAFIETIIYSISAGNMGIIFYRSMISIPIHLVASGIFGYYYGLAHFAKPIVKLEGGEKTYKTKLFHRLISLKKSTVYSEEKIVEGILFATLFHAAANLLFEFSLGYIAVPIIIFGIVDIFHLYKVGQLKSMMILRMLKKKRVLRPHPKLKKA